MPAFYQSNSCASLTNCDSSEAFLFIAYRSYRFAITSDITAITAATFSKIRGTCIRPLRPSVLPSVKRIQQPPRLPAATLLAAAWTLLGVSSCLAQGFTEGRDLYVDTSGIDQFRCGQFYSLKVYEEYRIEPNSPPRYREYGELLLYKPCLAPIEGGDFPVEIAQNINCLKCRSAVCGCDIGERVQQFVLKRIISTSIPSPRFLGGAVPLPATISSLTSTFRNYQVLVRDLAQGGNAVDALIRAKYSEYSEIYAPAFRPTGSRKTKYLFLLGLRSTGPNLGTLDLIVDPLSDVAECAELRRLLETDRLLGISR